MSGPTTAETLATYADVAISYDAVLLHLVDTGQWGSLVDRVRCGRRAATELDATQLGPAAQASEVAFRRAHGLLSADELRAWLDARNVTIVEWRTHLRGMAAGRLTELRGSNDSALADQRTEDDRSQDELETWLRIALIIEDLVPRAVTLLAQGAASLHLLEEQRRREIEVYGPSTTSESTVQPGESGAAFDVVDRALDEPLLPLRQRDRSALADDAKLVLSMRDARREVRDSVTPREIREFVAEHRLDWTRVRFDELSFRTESAAREATLCLRDDGLDVPEVERRAGVRATTKTCDTMELASATAGALLAVSVGEPVPPIAGKDRWTVMVLRERTAPSPDDPVVVERATDAVLEEKLQRRLAGRLVRHVDL